MRWFRGRRFFLTCGEFFCAFVKVGKSSVTMSCSMSVSSSRSIGSSSNLLEGVAPCRRFMAGCGSSFSGRGDL